MNKYKKFIFMLAIFSIAFFGIARDSLAVAPSDYGLHEGDLISAVFSNDPDIYIINNDGYKRLFLNQDIFNFYGHLGGFFNVKLVTTEVRDAFVTSGLLRNCEANDTKVYGVNINGEDTGTMSWVDVSGNTAVSQDPEFFKKIFCINDKEFKWYPKADTFKSVRDVPDYARMKKKSDILTSQVIKNHEDEYKEKHKEKDKNKKNRDDDDDDDDNDDDYYDHHIKNIGKVAICHKAKETITISPKALKAHIKHGDVIGSCDLTPVPNPNDTTAPIISSLSATSTTAVATHIKWITNENANGKVWYSVTSPVIATSTTSSISSAIFKKSHDITLSGLTASTTYYYLVESADLSGNKSVSVDGLFTTLVTPDTTAPIISDLSATSTTATIATITWTTNEHSDSTAWYSTTTPVPTTLNVNSAILTPNHSLSLAGLIGSTQYYYYVRSMDAVLNTATSTEFSFTTPAL
ncbi:MAG: hypothetical protein AAB614_02750 [Patescibacteria group bacterium]